MTTFQGTETYLIECSRENSAINIEDDDDTNGSWANETDFVIKRGDRISVEMVCANIRGSGTAAPTIEFSGQNVVVNNQQKDYCDTKVLLEVFFYLNNNNTYSVGMPLIHPYGGINGRGGHGNYDNLVTPFNLNPRIPDGNVTNQTRNYREVNFGVGYVYPDTGFGNWGIWDGQPPEPVYMNQPGNELPPGPLFSTRVTGISGEVIPWANAYQIYQFQTDINGVKTWLNPADGITQGTITANNRISGIRITPNAATTAAQTPAPYQPYNNKCLFTDYTNGILKGRTGQQFQNNFYVGNHIFISNNIDTSQDLLQVEWLGQIESIRGQGGLGNPAFNTEVLEIYFKDNNRAFVQYDYGLYAGPQMDFECGDCAVYVGGIFVDLGGYVRPKFDIKPGSSQEGLINYDNLELSTIARDVNGNYKGNGYMRGNNALFMYSRNTRTPQPGQQADLSLFPSTEFKPDVVTGSSPAKPFYTADAGEYGNLPAASQFGYRNANIQEENNNNPYIFMRNDHFGSGRRGMNNERMPDAEPMTAFIYVSLKELLQDVNSVSNVINERLKETITGIGTNIQQTSKLLVNSIENPGGRQPASNVTPYYNRIGFYDKSVTLNNQNNLMKDTNNAQYRNIVTDIIPIKNGGTVKVQPANFTAGRDYLAQNYGKQYGGTPGIGLFGENATQEQLDNNKETTYLREIETSSKSVEDPSGAVLYKQLCESNFNGWANPIYGNMATADLYKYQLGDRWSNLPVWNCDRASWTGGVEPIVRQVGKTIILNNKLEYNKLEFTFPQGANDYTGELSNFPNEQPEPLICNKLYNNQLIYTNIPFPTEDDEYGSWKKLAKAMRNYETYYNPTNNAPVTYQQQLRDVENWIFDGDVGMTDDRSTAQLRTQLGAPQNDPPNTAPDYPIVPPPTNPPNVPPARFQNNRPFYYDWLNQPATEAMLSADPTYGTALGLPQPEQLPIPAGGRPIPDYRPVVYGTDRDLMCPTTSHEIFAGVSATSCVDEEEKYKMLKELGRLKMKSRFNPDYYKVAKNYRGYNFPVPPIVIPQEVNDIGFDMSNTGENKIDTTFIRQLDIGFYPYEYKRGDGSTITLCALMVGTDYTPDVNRIQSINFGSMVWGQSIGISNSFFDNHAICPMNNDQVKRGQPLTKTTNVPGEWVRVGIQDTIEIEENQYYQAPAPPPTSNATAYTQTQGTDPQRVTTVWDFTTNFLAAPYVNTDGRFRCRLTLRNCLQFPGEEVTVIWEQGSLFTAGAVVDFQKVSTTEPDFYNPDAPTGFQFDGLYLNPNLNGTTNTWVLTSGQGIGNFQPTPAIAEGFGFFQVRGLGEPGAFHNGYYYTQDPTAANQFIEFGVAELSVYKQPQITPSTDTIPPNLGIEYNKVNYIWTGATQPTFQFNGEKGRVEFVQLQDDNILNQKSIPYTDEKINPSATTGTKAGIINTAAEDAVFSRNSRQDDFVNSVSTTPVKNSGIRAEISGVGIYKIWLCPEEYEPPNNVNLSSYWSNVAAGDDYWGQTEANRQKIIKDCVEADEGNWTGCLFERLGFQSHRELLPAYGRQQNRYNPTTFNQTRPDKISRGTKPLILCNAVDNSIDPALNTYFTADASGNTVNGIPMYSNGMLNDESVSLQLTNQSVTATAPPVLSTSPFLLIESDICSTNYRSGRTQQNVLFYLMKNYQASSFIYGYGSSYTHTANQDRMLSLIHTAFRDPITGRLQKCSNNSTIIYKIQRDIIIPPPRTDALGNALAEEKAPETETDKLLKQIVQNTESNTSRGGGSIGGGIGGGGRSGGGGSGVPLAFGGGAGGIAIEGPNEEATQVPLFQEGLIAQVLEEGGANLDVIGSAEAAQNLQNTFTMIDNMDMPDYKKEMIEGVAFTMLRLLQTFPIEIVQTPEGQIGLANPSFQVGGEELGTPFLDSSPESIYVLSKGVTQYLYDKMVEMGGAQQIYNLVLEEGEEGDAAADRLADFVNSIVINPLTGQRVGSVSDREPSAMEGLNEFGLLDFINRESSSSFQRMSVVMTDLLVKQQQLQNELQRPENLQIRRGVPTSNRGATPDERLVAPIVEAQEDLTFVQDVPGRDTSVQRLREIAERDRAEREARREFLENSFADVEAQLLDAISAVFRNAVMSGRRVRLADPQGRWVNSQLGGELSGIQNYPGLINSLRVVNPEGEYPEMATQYALSFSQVRALQRAGEELDAEFDDPEYERKFQEEAERQARGESKRQAEDVGERQRTPPSSPRRAQARKRIDRLKAVRRARERRQPDGEEEVEVEVKVKRAYQQHREVWDKDLLDHSVEFGKFHPVVFHHDPPTFLDHLNIHHPETQ